VSDQHVYTLFFRFVTTPVRSGCRVIKGRRILSISDNTRTILLLSGGLGRPREEEPHPLSPREFGRVAAWLSSRGLHPADLVEKDVEQIRQDPIRGLSTTRLRQLLQRTNRLDTWVDSLADSGIWVVSCEDSLYPSRLRRRLGPLKPPLLYGCGERALLDRGGLAVVGSRNADAEKLLFSGKAAQRCAAEGIQVVSGGARGVDRAAMLAALGEGGTVVGVLPGSLHRAAASRRWREGLASGRLALKTPFEPAAAFSVGAAMGRNRYIYLLSDWALAVDAAAHRGGTWAGAVEALKNRWLPVFVWLDEGVSEGNRLLEKRGAVPVTAVDLDQESLGEWLEQMARSNKPGQIRMF